MTIPDTVPLKSALRNRSPKWKLVKRYFASPTAVISFVCLWLIVGLAVLGPWIAPQNPYDLMTIDILDGNLPPASESMTGATYLLGTDEQGRDMLSAIIYGLRISLTIGITSVVIAVAIGTTIGLVSAYVGGAMDSFLMRLADFQLSFPAVLVALMILALLGKGVGNVVLAIVIVEWATYARLVRGVALAERQKEYIEAAECLAIPMPVILFRHLLPNCVSALIVVATIQIGRAIGLEATLSFLGVGVPVTEPSLGMLIANGYPYMLSGSFWISFYPGIALLVTVAAISLSADRLREILNPRGVK